MSIVHICKRAGEYSNPKQREGRIESRPKKTIRQDMVGCFIFPPLTKTSTNSTGQSTIRTNSNKPPRKQNKRLCWGIRCHTDASDSNFKVSSADNIVRHVKRYNPERGHIYYPLEIEIKPYGYAFTCEA